MLILAYLAGLLTFPLLAAVLVWFSLLDIEFEAGGDDD